MQDSIRKVGKPEDIEHLSEMATLGQRCGFGRVSLQGFGFPPILQGADIQTTVQFCFQSSAAFPVRLSLLICMAHSFLSQSPRGRDKHTKGDGNLAESNEQVQHEETNYNGESGDSLVGA